MGLLNRLSTLAQADAHGVVDAVEDRSLLLKQHLREAENDLHRKRARLEAIDLESKSLAQECERIEKTLARLEDDIAVALGGDKEELARFAIRKQIPLKRRLALAKQSIEAGASERTELAETLTQQESELEELRARVRAHLARVAAGARGDVLEAELDPVVADEEVEIELMRRMKTKRKGARS